MEKKYVRNAIKSFKWLVVSCNFGLLLLSIIQRNVEYCTNRGQFDDEESRSAFEIFFDWEFRQFEFGIEKDKRSGMRQRDLFEMLMQPSEPPGAGNSIISLFGVESPRPCSSARPFVHSVRSLHSSLLSNWIISYRQFLWCVIIFCFICSR